MQELHASTMEAFSRLILLKLFVNSGAEKGRIYYPRKGLKKITQKFSAEASLLFSLSINVSVSVSLEHHRFIRGEQSWKSIIFNNFR